MHLQLRPQFAERHGVHIIDEKNRVRVAHADTHRIGQRPGAHVQMQAVGGGGQRNARPIFHRGAHIGGDAAIGGPPAPHPAGQGLINPYPTVRSPA